MDTEGKEGEKKSLKRENKTEKQQQTTYESVIIIHETLNVHLLFKLNWSLLIKEVKV